jgi:hypothetical protein
VTQKGMVKSNIIRVRFKPEDEKALRSIQEFAGFSTISDTVRQMIKTGLSFYKERERKIKEIQEEISIFTIKPKELYPDIGIKRDYLGR